MRLMHVLAERGYSGGEVQLANLLRHLRDAGHENRMVLPPGGAFADAAADIGVPVTTVDLRRPLRTAAAVRLRRAVRLTRPDVLHFGCGRSLLWGGLFTLGLRGPLRVVTRRIDYPIGRSLYRGGRYRHLVDHVVANCRAVRDRVLAAGVPETRVTLVHEGIDVAPWLEIRRDRAGARTRLGLPADALVVSCAATLRPRKGQRVLIDAFAGIASSFPEAVLLLAGDGGDRRALTDRAARTGLGDRIRIAGAIKPVADVYGASDVFVMPSYNEGLSNACLEASAAGLPLVVTNVGGLPEIVEHGVTGSVVAPGDPAELGARLAEMLGDEGLRARAGQAGRERTTARFTAERMARGMEGLFLRLVEQRRTVGERRSSER